MGLFGFGVSKLLDRDDNTPTLNIPDAPQFQTAESARNEALGFAQQQTPLALGARESALADLGRGSEFFESFQPTSLEEALANQQFQNIFPDVQRQLRQTLSQSGFANSPILAELEGRARGELGVDIGTVLANLGQRRGEFSLQSRLGIDPLNSIINPLSEQALGQSNIQNNAQMERDFQQAIANFNAEQTAFSNQGAFGSSIGALLGGAGGFFCRRTRGSSYRKLFRWNIRRCFIRWRRGSDAN